MDFLTTWLVFGSIRTTEPPAMTQISPSPTAMLDGLATWIVAATRFWSGVDALGWVADAAGRGVEGRALGVAGCSVSVGSVGVVTIGAEPEPQAVNPATVRATINR